MLLAQPFPLPKASPVARPVSSPVPRRAPGFGLMLSSPVFCLGLTLLGLAPLLFA